MKRFLVQSVLITLILVGCVLFDGILSIYTHGAFVTYEHQMIWQLTYVVIFSFMLFLPQHSYMAIGFILGLLYDFYYSQILTYFTIPLIIMIYLFNWAKPLIKRQNFILYFLLFIFLIVSMNSLQYVMGIVHQLESVPFLTYVTRKIVPTVLLNALCFTILYPLTRTFCFWVDKQ